MNGWDPLAAFIAAGRERGIEVHPWLHMFMLGRDSLRPPGPVLSEHPGWRAVPRGGVRLPGEHWASPALPGARDFLSQVVGELVARYRPAGLHLDYLRYPTTTTLAADHSYDRISRRRFRARHGADPLTLHPEKTPGMWRKWTRWRQRQVTSFLARPCREVKAKAPRVVLSAPVYPDRAEALQRRYQEWPAWTATGLLDLVIPMAYHRDPTYVATEAAKLGRLVRGRAEGAVGLGVAHGLTPPELIDQTARVARRGGVGHVDFSSRVLGAAHLSALRQGPHRQRAELPWRQALPTTR